MSGGFEHISAPIARLKAEIEAAIRARDEAAAADAHAELIEIEHRDRVVRTVRKYTGADHG